MSIDGPVIMNPVIQINIIEKSLVVLGDVNG
jgi:hypothetical protein